MPYFDEPIGRVEIQTPSAKFSATLHNKKSNKKEIYYPTRQIVMSVRACAKFCGYLFTGNAWQKHVKRNEIGAENLLSNCGFSSFDLSNKLGSIFTSHSDSSSSEK